MAAAKAAEADTELGLDFFESQMLKHLLKRVIRSTAQGPLKIWPSHIVKRDPLPQLIP